MESHKTERPKTENQESHGSIEAVFEHMLQEGQELGAGKDGIVFKVDLASLQEDERYLLAEGHVITSVDEVNAMAAKILKVYNPELGEHEFQMQKKAREMLSREENVARIPNTTTARDQRISTETQNYLNSHGAELKDRAEIIMMDYIEGQDLGDMMYDFALQQMGHEDEYITDLSYSQKEQIVGQALGFERPDVDSAYTLEEKESAQARTFDRNEDKLFKYLKREGFKLDPSIFEKVDNAVRILNQKGLYHNDLHKRNVMVGTDGEVYIIDFGRADKEKRKDGIADILFSKKWKGLSVSEEDERTQKHQQELEQMIRLQRRLQEHPKQKERIDTFVQSVRDSGSVALEREFALSRGNDSKFEQFLIMLIIARDADNVETETVNAFVTSLDNNERRLSPFEKNKVQKLKQIGYL